MTSSSYSFLRTQSKETLFSKKQYLMNKTVPYIRSNEVIYISNSLIMVNVSTRVKAFVTLETIYGLKLLHRACL
jgi:hypothetical protein